MKVVKAEPKVRRGKPIFRETAFGRRTLDGKCAVIRPSVKWVLAQKLRRYVSRVRSRGSDGHGECEMADKVLGGAEFSFNLVCLLI